MVFKISRAVTAAEKELCFEIRHIVFVEEQRVPLELEIDEFDSERAQHFLGYLDKKPIATARICVFGENAKIQRVALFSKYRGKGLGRDLMEFLLDHIRTQKLAPEMVLDAQTYSVPFYEALGFEAFGDEFDDAGIPHIRMKQIA